MFSRTLCGLTGSYFFRQLFFGMIIAAGSLVDQHSTKGLRFNDIQPFTIIATLLYPYSRFLYEEIIGILLGSNVFIMPALIMLPAKYFTMGMCWILSIGLAPIAWIYLFCYHASREKANPEYFEESSEPWE